MAKHSGLSLLSFVYLIQNLWGQIWFLFLESEMKEYESCNQHNADVPESCLPVGKDCSLCVFSPVFLLPRNEKG